ILEESLCPAHTLFIPCPYPARELHYASMPLSTSLCRRSARATAAKSSWCRPTRCNTTRWNNVTFGTVRLTSSTATGAGAGAAAFEACRSNSPFDVTNFIDGEMRKSASAGWMDINSPATQALVCRVPRSTHEEMEAAVSSAQEAFLSWRDVPVQHRARVMFKLQGLIRERTEELAAIITMEQGKTLADARGDVFRGLEVVEQACGVGVAMMGE
ncbi:unnamed protein product, partial [Laminaria digitata]